MSAAVQLTTARAPGFYKRMPFDTYLSEAGTNVSRLKDVGRSPKLYQFRADHPRKTTEPMRLGTAAHTAILEPHRFLAEYALWDERTEKDPEKVSPRRGAKWEACLAANPGKKIVRADEYGVAMAMRDAVRGHKAAMRYLRAGDPEVGMWWRDEEFERLCKARVDWLTTDNGFPVLVGLKTARDGRPIQFGNAAARLGYHLQWGFYADGYKAITGKEARVVEIVVESAPPHDVAVYVIPSDVREQGRAEYRALLETLQRCEAADAWPGMAEEEQMLSLPAWVYQGDEDLEGLGLDLGDGAIAEAS